MFGGSSFVKCLFGVHMYGLGIVSLSHAAGLVGASLCGLSFRKLLEKF